jgi:hypothetical protein
MKLVQRRVPQEATLPNAAAIGLSALPTKPGLIAAALLGGGAMLTGDSEAGAPKIKKSQLRQMEMERIRLEQESAAKMQLMQAETKAAKERGANEAEQKALAEKQAAELAEYQRQVKLAEHARDTELGRKRRFSDTTVGKGMDALGGLAPFLAGVMGGKLSRLATGPGKSAVGEAMKDYVAPMAAGTLGAFTAANVPLAYDSLYTDPDNPEKAAYSAYSRELPPTHPRKKEFLDYAGSLPDANPVRENASKEFYDPHKLTERAGMSFIEGAGGALMGSDGVRAIARALIGKGRSAAPTVESIAAPRKLAPPHEGPNLHHSNFQPRVNGSFKKGKPRFPAND